jgi:hypothetical protein
MIAIKTGIGKTLGGKVTINLNERCACSNFNCGCFHYSKYTNYSVQITPINVFKKFHVSKIEKGEFVVYVDDIDNECLFYWNVFCERIENEYMGF